MKAVFFSVLALATSAFAAPVAETRDLTQVQDAVANVEGIVEKLGVTQIIDEATHGATKRQVASVSDVISVLTGAVNTIKTQTSAITVIVQQVQAGSLSPADGATAAAPNVQAIHFTLTDIVTELTGAAGLPVDGTEVDTVLELVTVLVSQVLDNVKTLVTVLGLQTQLTVLLNDVFVLLAKILVLLNGLIAGLLPGLISFLSPLLAGLGNGVLAPLLTPIIGVVTSLAAGLP